MIENCWKEGRGKAGQGPRQRAKAKKNQEGTQLPKEAKTAMIEEVTDQEASMHAFTALPIANDRAPIRKKSYIFDSGASDHISPHKMILSPSSRSNLVLSQPLTITRSQRSEKEPW
jgi:hypothetical protein